MNLVLVVTGSLPSAYAPAVVDWIRAHRRDVEVRAVRTRPARAYVTRPALQQLCHRDVVDDEWEPDTAGLVQHVDLGEWADAVLAYPATPDYVDRVAGGDRDSPSLLLIAGATVPVVLAPVAHLGGGQARAFRARLAQAATRAGVEVVAAPAGRGDAPTRHVNECLDVIDRALEERAHPGGGQRLAE